MQINRQLLDSTTLTGVMWFVAPFVKYKYLAGRLEMISLRNINVGVHPAGSLKDGLLETFLFVLMTSLVHHHLNNNLTVAMTCMRITCSTDLIRVVSAVSTYLL